MRTLDVTTPHVLLASRISPFHEAGGMQAIAWDIARALASHARVTFLTTQIPNEDEEFLRDGVLVHAITNTRPGRYTRRWWMSSRSFFERCPPKSIDAVLSVSAGAYGILRSKHHHPAARFVMQAHGTSMGEFRSKWRSRSVRAIAKSPNNLVWLLRDLMIYRRFDAVIAVGEAVQRALLYPPIRWVLPASRVTLIRNGVDTKLFVRRDGARELVRGRLGLTAAHRLIVTTTRLDRQKGVDLALRGFGVYAAKDTQARYLVIGDGPEKSALERLSTELGLAAKVSFVGAISRESVADYLSAGDGFLFTSVRIEGLPLNVLEAAAVGLPLVLSASLRATVQASGEVRYVTPTRAAEIAVALEALFKNVTVVARRSELPSDYTLQHCAALYRRTLFDTGAEVRGDGAFSS